MTWPSSRIVNDPRESQLLANLAVAVPDQEGELQPIQDLWGTAGSQQLLSNAVCHVGFPPGPGFLLLPLMRRTETISLDFDWIWRVGLVRLLRVLGGAWNRIAAALAALLDAVGGRLGRNGRRYFGSRVEDGQQVHGMFARAWPIGTTALWIAVLLTAYVFFYYLA